MTRHLRNLGNEFSISLPTDSEGYLGRNCSECKSYFKIVSGTGLKGILTCVCPYCGHKADHSEFHTQEQIDYATSIVTRQVMNAVTRDLKDMATGVNRRSSGGLLSLTMDIKTGLSPIQRYAEKELETHVECDSCTLKYSIFGVFGYCPDCAVHNSRQILLKNLELAGKELGFAESSEDSELRQYLVADALENAVSAFDGFGREIVAVHKDASSNPTKAASLSFQNLANANEKVEQLFGFWLEDGLGAKEWTTALQCFQKRHLLAHKMGVVDQKYVDSTGDPVVKVGHKVPITLDEVRELLMLVKQLGTFLSSRLGEVGCDVSANTEL